MKPADPESAARAIAAFLRALGYDPDSPELAGTPERVAEAFASELLAGERVDLARLVSDGTCETRAASGLIVMRDIAVTCVCPHHLLPALGHACIGYVPGGRLLGLGTLTRIAAACTQRLALQETVGESIVQALLEHAGARGAFCRLRLWHTCLASRGSRHPEARVISLARGGCLAGESGLREIELALAGGETP